MPFRILRIVAFYAALVGIWQAVVELVVWPNYVVPPPREVVDSFWTYLDNGLITDAIQTSMQRLIIGYSISLVIGM